MQRHVFQATESAAAFPGAVLCRDLTVPDGKRGVTIRRGTPLDEALRRLPPDHGPVEFTIVTPDAGEIAQPDASALLAEGIRGEGIVLEPPHQGQVNVHAGDFGLLRVRGDGVARLNQTGVALIATALDGRVVEADETVAVVKAPALYVSREAIDAALGHAGREPIVRVAPFRVRRVGLLAGTRIRPQNLKVSSGQMATTLARFGADLGVVRHLTTDAVDQVADAYRQLIEEGAGILLVAGSIMLDPGDPFMVAVERLGGRIAVRGAPVDPGTMFWVAYLGEVPVFGLASCELYGRTSILDLLLPYALAGEPVTRDLLATLGHGGLLVETMAARRPPGWGERA